MIHENFDPFDEVDPTKKQPNEDDSGDYDILPSNGPGLADDDGEQVVSEGEVAGEDDDEEDDESDDD